MLNAMSLTALRQFFMHSFTNLFPAKRIPDDLTGALKAASEGKIALNPPVPVRGRFRGKLNYDRAKCIGCGLCQKVCPANAISRDPDEAKKMIFHADRCCFCAQCNDICPVQALTMGTEFAFASQGGEAQRKAQTAEKDSGKSTGKPFQAQWLDADVEEFLPPERESQNPDEGRKDDKEATEANNVATPRTIDESKCVGCTLCAKSCPAGAITGTVKQPHHIDESKCEGCGICEEKCPKGAIGTK